MRRLWSGVAAVLCGLLMLPLSAEAQRDGRRSWWWGQSGRTGLWDKLGEQRVGFNVDRDVIRVGRREGRFEALKLRVEGNDIQLIRARVQYGNGQTEELRVSGLYRAGSETEPVRLDDRGRAIEAVELTYRSNPRLRGEAVVELWGLHSDNDRRDWSRPRMERAPPMAPLAPPPGRGPSWEMLGERQVDLRTERDTVQVGRWEGGFTQIRLKVLGADIDLRDVTIVYAGGGSDSWPIRRRVRDEEEGPVFDLPGRRRAVERVIMTYRATNPFSRTRVQVWGGRQ